MRISSSTAGGGGVPSSRKAQIEAQIKKLEARKQKVMKQMSGGGGGGGGGGSAPAASTSNATVSTGSTKPAAQPAQTSIPTSLPQERDGESSSLSQISAPSLDTLPAIDTSQLSADLQAAVQGGGSGGGGGGGGGGGAVPDVSGIMKQIMQIDMQIMSLRSQIGDDGLDSLMQAAAGGGGNVDPAAMASAIAARQQATADNLASTPTPSASSSDRYPPVTVSDGRVDGYI